MDRLTQRLAWILRHPLSIFLPLQSLLLFWRLDLLPIWGDEQFTLMAAQQSLGQLFETVGRDIHPPLYFALVHFWLRIPWPASPETSCRALSVLFALAAGVMIDRFWLTGLRRSTRIWFLLLWTFSGCLVLYARMARSYTLQLLLTCLAVRLATNLLRSPREIRRLLCYSGAAACLLYVHYLPGIATVLSVTLWFVWESVRRRQPGLLLPVIVADILVALMYAPWLRYLHQAVGQVAGAEPYSPLGFAGAGHILGLGYGFFSFAFGETSPPWTLGVAVVLAPAVLWLVYRGAAHSPDWFRVVAPLALIACLGASRWVSFAFVPARVFYLLPFFVLLVVRGREEHRRIGTVACAALLVVSSASMSSYFRRQNFLNKGYLVPCAEIAALIDQSPAGTKAVVIADMLNTDPWPVLARLRREMPVVEVRGDRGPESLLEEIRRPEPDTVWYFRNTHDISPDAVHQRLEAELAKTRDVRRRFFVPYSPLDRKLMKLLGWRDQPTHCVQLLEMHRR